MNETKFKVGDRVRAIKEDDGNTRIIGKTGTVKKNWSFHGEPICDIEFDEYVNGLDLDGRCEHGKGWSCFETTLEPVHDNSKIVITTDGKRTTAKLYDGKKFIKSAEAICSLDDEFDFNIGAAIALERLTGQLESTLEVEEHFYNGKVVCVSSGCYETAFTLGKIYEITEGELKAENCAYLTEIKKVSEINEHFKREGVKFLEIVE
jgi:hypothetical protein